VQRVGQNVPGFTLSSKYRSFDVLHRWMSCVHATAGMVSFLKRCLKNISMVPVDVQLESAQAEDYDALVLPGGVLNPDQLLLNTKAVEFAQQFLESGKPVGRQGSGHRQRAGHQPYAQGPGCF